MAFTLVFFFNFILITNVSWAGAPCTNQSVLQSAFPKKANPPFNEEKFQYWQKHYSEKLNTDAATLLHNPLIGTDEQKLGFIYAAINHADPLPIGMAKIGKRTTSTLEGLQYEVLSDLSKESGGNLSLGRVNLKKAQNAVDQVLLVNPENRKTWSESFKKIFPNLNFVSRSDAKRLVKERFIQSVARDRVEVALKKFSLDMPLTKFEKFQKSAEVMQGIPKIASSIALETVLGHASVPIKPMLELFGFQHASSIANATTSLLGKESINPILPGTGFLTAQKIIGGPGFSTYRINPKYLLEAREKPWAEVAEKVIKKYQYHGQADLTLQMAFKGYATYVLYNMGMMTKDALVPVLNMQNRTESEKTQAIIDNHILGYYADPSYNRETILKDVRRELESEPIATGEKPKTLSDREVLIYLLESLKRQYDFFDHKAPLDEEHYEAMRKYILGESETKPGL